MSKRNYRRTTSRRKRYEMTQSGTKEPKNKAPKFRGAINWELYK